MSKNIDKRLWGVLGKQQTFFSPQKQVQGKTKVPLNANAFDSWDVKRSRFKRVDGYENAVQQGGVVPQATSGPVVSPTPSPTLTQTPTNTPSPTPSFTPTMTQTQTPSLTPSSTPYPLPINPSLWWDATDSSTFTLISSGGTNYVSRWNSKGTSTWSLSGTNTDLMPVLSASTLMPGNPNIVRFVPNATTTLRDALSSFGNTQISHTGGTWFYVWAKPSGSTYATSLYTSAVYSGFTNGGTVNNSSGGFIDRQFFNLTNVAGMSNNYSIGNNQIIALTTPVYSATGLNDKYILSCNFQDTTGEFNYLEINQSAQTNTTSFTGSSAVGTVNSFIMGMTITTSAGTQSYNNSNIELAEVMWFNVDLTPAQREQVELYLKDKWRYDEWASPVPTPTPTASPTQTTTNTPTPTPSTTPPFNPSFLSPNIWVDFSDAATITTRTSGSQSFITRITNKGVYGGLTAFTQSTAANQPLIAPTTYFSGSGLSAVTISNDYLDSIIQTTASTVWTKVYVITNTTGQNNAPFRFTDGTNSYANYNHINSTTFRKAWAGSGGFYRRDCSLVGRPSTGQTVIDFTDTTNPSITSSSSINGTSTTESIVAGSNYVHAGGYPLASTLTLINDPGDGTIYNGEIGEMFFFTRGLTGTETTNLLNYLKTKWNLKY